MTFGLAPPCPCRSVTQRDGMRLAEPRGQASRQGLPVLERALLPLPFLRGHSGGQGVMSSPGLRSPSGAWGSPMMLDPCRAPPALSDFPSRSQQGRLRRCSLRRFLLKGIHSCGTTMSPAGWMSPPFPEATPKCPSPSCWRIEPGCWGRSRIVYQPLSNLRTGPWPGQCPPLPALAGSGSPSLTEQGGDSV